MPAPEPLYGWLKLAASGAPIVEAARLADGGLDVQSGHATARFTTEGRSYPPMRLGLAGRHQVGNAAVAVRLLELADAAGMGVDAAAIRVGIEEARWPARLEWLRTSGGDVLIDAAHNPAGLAVTLQAVAESFGFHRLIVVLSVLGDKDARGMLKLLDDGVDAVVVTENSSPRAVPADDLAAIAVDVLGPDRVEVEVRLVDAIEAGATAVIQPGGSVRDDEVIKAADDHGVAMVFTGTRHFRH